ncbi:Osmotically inducible protein Y [Xenorhabdus vietnamensis]|uniref:Osmotically inducible protein Y n=1 Tax=Xenorhabdus vietnamensis TaxID=351656 RepID=A0A1Y2SIK1_9GAMM|nr:BON domain-containing protein [Xenorhabdus vietnamensis]OTA18236.1 Osmotically inducible protein Y [Xenorhabdus vietnamensis]
MNKSQFAHSLVAVVLGSVLVSGSAFANNIFSGKTQSSQGAEQKAAQGAGQKAAQGTEQKVDWLLKKSEKKVTKPSQNAGSSIKDIKITTEVKGKLQLQKNINTDDILVKTEKGIVYIAGFVKNSSQKMKIVALAKSVKGVKSVRHALVIKK